MSKRFLLILLAAVVAFSLCAADQAQAKRLGGGSSSGAPSGFGSSSGRGSYDSPTRSTPPPSQVLPSRDQGLPPPQSPLPGPGLGTAAAPSRPFGGFLGGMLAGGLIGSMLSGGQGGGFPGGGGLGLLDMLLIGGGIYLLFRLLKSRQNPSDQDQSQGQSQDQSQNRPQERDISPPSQPGPETDQAAELRREAAERYARAQAGWDMLRTKPSGQSAPPSQTPTQAPPQATTQDFGLDDPRPVQAPAALEIPPGFDQAEFLRGAKAVYARLQASWDTRDLEDIRHFTTPDIFAGFERDAKADPGPSSTEIMLVNASLLGVTSQGSQTKASVLYDVLLREDPKADHPEQVKEIWNFTRDESNPKDHWRLEGIEQPQ